MKNIINKIVSSFWAIVSGVFCFIIGWFVSLMVLVALFPTAPPQEGVVNIMPTIIVIVSILVGLGVGFVGGMYIYYVRRERGYADSHVKISNRDW